MTKADAYNLGNTYCEFSMPKSEITNTAFTSRNVRREKSTYLLILAFECTLDYWFPQILSWLLRAHFLDATRAATQFPVTRNSQITDNLLKSSFSRDILDIYPTVSRQIHSPFVILQFPHSILNFVRKNPKQPFFKCHAWISSYSVFKVSETDNVGIFSLSRSAWGL